MVNRILKILIAITFLLLFVVIGLIIYVYTRNTFQGSTEYSPETSKRKNADPKTNVLNKKTAESAKKKELNSVLFLMDESDSDLISAVLYVRFDKKKKRLSFFSLPKDLTFEIGKDLYNDLSVGITGIPQIARISHLYTYSRTKAGMKAGMLMINDLLGTEADGCIMLKPETHKKIFYFNEAGDASFRTEFREKLLSGKGMNRFVSEHYEQKYSDFDEGEISRILKECRKLKRGIITFKKLPFKESNMGDLLDKGGARRLINGDKK